jgi:butyryl-CoA dehydrogenase
MDTRTRYLGLELKNPLVASASPVSRSLDNIKQLEDNGAAAVVMFSLFEEQLQHESDALNHLLHSGSESFPESLSYFPQFDEDVGGLQLPTLFAQAMSSLFPAANVSTSNYTFLTTAAANLLKAHGSEEQQQRFMLPMLEGRFFGTMCLSEPHAGSSLADIKTRATPLDDGRYRITGNKMWISGGDHELSENIVHMVLAKIEGAPPGVKGISLFIVPKKRVGADGSTGERNGVELVGLNHKMGHRGTTNCALAFGDNDECIGELVGEPHKGLPYMFHMMNEARIGVGMAAVGLGYAGYLYALDYTRQRPQGRSLVNKDPSSPPVPIIDHPDVRPTPLA